MDDDASSIVEWRPPPGFVNPVPEPGAPRPRKPVPDGARHPVQTATAPAQWRVSDWRTWTWGGRLLIIAVVIGLVAFRAGLDWVASGGIDAVIDSIDGTPAAAPVSGNVALGDGAVTATFTPVAGEWEKRERRSNADFSAEDWTLRIDRGQAIVRDYRFRVSPVKDAATTRDYYAAGQADFERTARQAAKPQPISVTGREGRAWRATLADGKTYLLAEFPGDPHTIRVQCSAWTPAIATVAQCEQILSSLRINE